MNPQDDTFSGHARGLAGTLGVILFLPFGIICTGLSGIMNLRECNNVDTVQPYCDQCDGPFDDDEYYDDEYYDDEQ